MPYIECNGKRVLFIHIPKTGGTTVERWLEQHSALRLRSSGVPDVSRSTPQHFRMSDIRNFFGDNYFDYIFSFVRNPYDRIESEFRMHAVLQKGGFWKEHQSFSIWLETNLAKAAANPFHLDNHFRAQWEFIGSNVEVFKLEDGLETGLATVSNVLGIPAPTALEHQLSTADLQLDIEWDLSDRLRVQKNFDKDFELFGYDR